MKYVTAPNPLTRDQSADEIRKRLDLPYTETGVAVAAHALLDPVTGDVAAVIDSEGNLRFTKGGTVNNNSLFENFAAYDTTDQVAILTATGLTGAGTGNLLNHIYTPGKNKFAWVGIVGQTILPSIVANGLDIGGDQTTSDGAELFTHFAGATGMPFIVGKDPGFYFRAKVLIADVSALNPLFIGFRRAEVNNATLASYADYVGFGFNSSADPAAIKLISEVNGSAPSSFPVDTTQTLADARAYTVEIRVSGAGVVTFLHDATTAGVMAAPTAVGTAPTLDNGDPFIPCIHFINGGDNVGEFAVQEWEAGYQN